MNGPHSRRAITVSQACYGMSLLRAACVVTVAALHVVSFVSLFSFLSRLSVRAYLATYITVLCGR